MQKLELKLVSRQVLECFILCIHIYIYIYIYIYILRGYIHTYDAGANICISYIAVAVPRTRHCSLGQKYTREYTGWIFCVMLRRIFAMRGTHSSPVSWNHAACVCVCVCVCHVLIWLIHLSVIANTRTVVSGNKHHDSSRGHKTRWRKHEACACMHCMNLFRYVEEIVERLYNSLVGSPVCQNARKGKRFSSHRWIYKSSNSFLWCWQPVGQDTGSGKCTFQPGQAWSSASQVVPWMAICFPPTSFFEIDHLLCEYFFGRVYKPSCLCEHMHENITLRGRILTCFKTSGLRVVVTLSAVHGCCSFSASHTLQSLSTFGAPMI